MKLICGPETFDLCGEQGDQRVILYGQRRLNAVASAGDAARHEILKRNLEPAPRAWDLLSIALSVITADFAGLRDKSPDGWTREFKLDIAVGDPDFWTSQAANLEASLAFLTTDRWRLQFHPGGILLPQQRQLVRPNEDSVVLISGGLDSLIGAVDLVAAGKRPFAISQTVRGDAEKQLEFATSIGDGLNQLQLNHNVCLSSTDESSQRARSLIFISYGVLAATTLQRYHQGETVPLYVCENGFIGINPPLTGSRIGSLSTRTAHPEFLGRLQRVLDAAELRVLIQNPYACLTKGEMLRNCADQALLKTLASRSTSCGRFQRFNYRQCGRCVPCQVRRAAFLTWGDQDATGYVYENLGRDSSDYARFDDVRSVAMALAAVATDGLDTWMGGALSYPNIQNRVELRDMIQRGLNELKVLHQLYGVQ